MKRARVISKRNERVHIVCDVHICFQNNRTNETKMKHEHLAEGNASQIASVGIIYEEKPERFFFSFVNSIFSL